MKRFLLFIVFLFGIEWWAWIPMVFGIWNNDEDYPEWIRNIIYTVFDIHTEPKTSSDETLEDKVTKFIDDMTGEYDSTSINEKVEIYAKFYRKGLTEGSKKPKKIVQKHTWGGDDEKLINNVIELINNGSLDRDEKDFYIEKLESLKERVQSNGEWTEEDEQTVRFYEAYTNNQVGNCPQNKVLEMKSKFNDWVKEVKYRVQPQWKPSKEQLTALEHVSSEYIGSWQPEMLTLFDDLKTLYDNYNKSEK